MTVTVNFPRGLWETVSGQNILGTFKSHKKKKHNTYSLSDFMPEMVLTTRTVSQDSPEKVKVKRPKQGEIASYPQIADLNKRINRETV